MQRRLKVISIMKGSEMDHLLSYVYIHSEMPQSPSGFVQLCRSHNLKQVSRFVAHSSTPNSTQADKSSMSPAPKLEIASHYSQK